MSAVKRVRVDAAQKTATLVWQHAPVDAYPTAARFPTGYSEVFGDADLLPNGNVLSAWWPRHLAPGDGVDFDVQLLQVTPGKDVAWSLSFANTGHFSGPCETIDDAGCERLVLDGWKIYSAEHFYDAPRVSNAAATPAAARDGDARGDGGATQATYDVAFDAHAPFKRNAPSRGTWTLRDAAGADVATGDLEFDAHFRTRSYVVAVDGLDAAAAPFVVRVADEFANHADAQITMR